MTEYNITKNAFRFIKYRCGQMIKETERNIDLRMNKLKA